MTHTTIEDISIEKKIINILGGIGLGVLWHVGLHSFVIGLMAGLLLLISERQMLQMGIKDNE